jgi:Protein of unknown function (DUF3563)
MKHFSRFFDWLNQSVANSETSRREAFLAQATDTVDLEYRMRKLERNSVQARPWW